MWSKLLLILIFIFLCLNNISAQSQPFRFVVNFEAFTNLTYQLDCLTNFNYCHQEDFAALWKQEFLKDDADKTMLENWRKIRGRYQKTFEVENDLKFPLDRRATSTNLSDKIQIGGFQAKNLDEYLTRLDLLVVPREREEFAKVIRHFQPKFSEWWAREAKEKGVAFAKKTEELLDSQLIKENTAKFYNFYQPSLPTNYLVTFDLMFRPNLVKAGSSGYSMENHLVVEFFPTENPKNRIDVVLHEFCHFLFNSITPEKHIELQNIFLKSGRVSAVPAFSLLDEGLASAFGNGIIVRAIAKPEIWQKYLATEMSFYGNPNIDKAGKTILPVVDDWLSKNGKLNDENFVKTYLDAIEKAFGNKLTTPTLYLGQSFVFMDGKFDQSLRRSIRQTLHIASLYSESGDLAKTELKDYFDSPNLSSVFIVQPTSMNQLVSRKIISDKDLKEIQKIYKAEKKALFSFKRNENAYTFIVVAENDESAKQLIQDLANAPKSFVGKFVKTI